MKVYIVTKGFRNPRYYRVAGVYQKVFSTIYESRRYIEQEIAENAYYLGSIKTGEFVGTDGVVFIEGRHRKYDQYFVYEIHEEVV